MKAEKIFTGGAVITMDENEAIYEAIATSGDKILAVGTAGDISKLAGEKTEIIDLKGRALTPGFIDAHLHTAVLGANSLAIDLRSPGVSSIEEIKQKVKEAAEIAPAGAWIRGWGYDQSKLKEKRHPNKWDLDEAAPNNPVMLTRVCAHISTHNSKSLEIAGISDSSEPIAGGEFERIDGKVSGVMFENAHMNMMKVAALSKEEIIAAMISANNLLVSEGITSVHDSGGYGSAQMRAIQEATESGKIDIRIYAMIFSFVENLKFVDDYLKIGVNSKFGNSKFKLGPVKIMIDGSSSGPTAATRKPYASDKNSSGIMSMTKEEIDDFVMRAHIAGWQVTCHAVGDKAISAMLDAYEKAQKKRPIPPEIARHRIEHSAMMTEGLMERIKKLGIIPIPQPIFLYEFGDGYIVNYGKERADRMFPCGDFIRNGILPAGSSDCPITFSNPLLNMHVAVNRETQTGQKVGEKEAVSITDALKMFTIGSAYAAFEENIKGSLKPNMLADFAILSENILDTPKEKIRDIKVDMTVIGGREVFNRHAGS